MQPMRDLLRTSLARSLRSFPDEDRLAAALPLVCGAALAAHCQVHHLDAARVLHLQVDAPEWLNTLLPMRDLLQHDLARVAAVPLAGLHFIEAAPTRPGTRPNPSQPLKRNPA